MDPHDPVKKLKRPADEPPDPALQAHIDSLGLDGVEEYVAWCARHGFSRRTAKHGRLRLKERAFAARAAADARLARKKQEVRRPENAIQAIFRGEVTEEQVTEAHLKTVCRAFKSSKSCPRTRRCLIPADGFFEWMQLPGRRKQPWHFRLKGRGPFAFAGIWDAWRPEYGPPPLTCALLTTAANGLVQPVHNRMPLIPSPSDYAAWIDRGNEDVGRLAALPRPFPTELMEARPVGPLVNNPRNDGPECLAPPAP
jgi:putative SOS response-associated peptidase YedK